MAKRIPDDIRPDQTAEAIRRIRKRLGLTLDEFSKKLGVSLVSAARYESTRPPKGQALARIAEKAAKFPGCEAEAFQLAAAVSAELSTWSANEIKAFEPRNDAERLWIASILIALRNPEHGHLLPGLAKALQAPAKEVTTILEKQIASKKVAAEIGRLLKLGVRSNAIAEDQGVPLESVEAIERLEQFAASLREIQKEGAEANYDEMLDLLTKTKKGETS